MEGWEPLETNDKGSLGIPFLAIIPPNNKAEKKLSYFRFVPIFFIKFYVVTYFFSPSRHFFGAHSYYLANCILWYLILRVNVNSNCTIPSLQLENLYIEIKHEISSSLNHTHTQKKFHSQYIQIRTINKVR